MILKVGLTGGLASGKSSVGRHMADLGAVVIDADRVVHELYQPGEPGHRALIERYGDSVLSSSGEIDRVTLSRMALSTSVGASELNALIHPLVIEEERRKLAEIESRGSNVIVIVEATLLLESGGKDRYDYIIVVDTNPEEQVTRAVKRGLSEEEARTRMSRQMARADRRALADFVIDSSGSLGETLGRANAVWQQLVAALATRAK